MLLSVVLLCSECFQRGDNVEELCLPLLMISMYYLLRAIPLPRASKSEAAVVRCDFLKRTAFRIGIVVKFNLVGFWTGWSCVTFLPLLFPEGIPNVFPALSFVFYRLCRHGASLDFVFLPEGCSV